MFLVTFCVTIELVPWNSNTAEIFEQRTYSPSFIVLCLIVGKLWCPQTNKKHLKNVGPIRHCEPPLAQSPGVATIATVARRLRIDVHDNANDDNNANDNDNA